MVTFESPSIPRGFPKFLCVLLVLSFIQLWLSSIHGTTCSPTLYFPTQLSHYSNRTLLPFISSCSDVLPNWAIYNATVAFHISGLTFVDLLLPPAQSQQQLGPISINKSCAISHLVALTIECNQRKGYSSTSHFGFKNVFVTLANMRKRYEHRSVFVRFSLSSDDPHGAKMAMLMLFREQQCFVKWCLIFNKTSAGIQNHCIYPR